MDICFILMAPARPENVGAAARAMKTMGFSQMRVVASMVHTQPEAQWVAHGAQEILSQAESYDSLAEAVADLDLIVATTARQRGQQHRIRIERRGFLQQQYRYGEEFGQVK